jgi:hypothetical protein
VWAGREVLVDLGLLFFDLNPVPAQHRENPVASDTKLTRKVELKKKKQQKYRVKNYPGTKFPASFFASPRYLICPT